jgi:hypothetical protein
MFDIKKIQDEIEPTLIHPSDPFMHQLQIRLNVAKHDFDKLKNKDDIWAIQEKYQEVNDLLKPKITDKNQMYSFQDKMNKLLTEIQSQLTERLIEQSKPSSSRYTRMKSGMTERLIEQSKPSSSRYTRMKSGIKRMGDSFTRNALGLRKRIFRFGGTRKKRRRNRFTRS